MTMGRSSLSGRGPNQNGSSRSPTSSYYTTTGAGTGLPSSRPSINPMSMTKNSVYGGSQLSYTPQNSMVTPRGPPSLYPTPPTASGKFQNNNNTTSSDNNNNYNNNNNGYYMAGNPPRTSTTPQLQVPNNFSNQMTNQMNLNGGMQMNLANYGNHQEQSSYPQSRQRQGQQGQGSGQMQGQQHLNSSRFTSNPQLAHQTQQQQIQMMEKYGNSSNSWTNRPQMQQMQIQMQEQYDQNKHGQMGNTNSNNSNSMMMSYHQHQPTAGMDSAVKRMDGQQMEMPARMSVGNFQALNSVRQQQQQQSQMQEGGNTNSNYHHYTPNSNKTQYNNNNSNDYGRNPMMTSAATVGQRPGMTFSTSSQQQQQQQQHSSMMSSQNSSNGQMLGNSNSTSNSSRPFQPATKYYYNHLQQQQQAQQQQQQNINNSGNDLQMQVQMQPAAGKVYGQMSMANRQQMTSAQQQMAQNQMQQQQQQQQRQMMMMSQQQQQQQQQQLQNQQMTSAVGQQVAQTIRVGAPPPGGVLEPQTIRVTAPIQAYDQGQGGGQTMKMSYMPQQQPQAGDSGEYEYEQAEDGGDGEQKVKYIPMSWNDILGGGSAGKGLEGLKVIMAAPPSPDAANQNRQLRVAFGNQPVMAGPGETPLKVLSIEPVEGYEMGPLSELGDNNNNNNSDSTTLTQQQSQKTPKHKNQTGISANSSASKTQSLTSPMAMKNGRMTLQQSQQQQQHQTQSDPKMMMMRGKMSPSSMRLQPPPVSMLSGGQFRSQNGGNGSRPMRVSTPMSKSMMSAYSNASNNHSFSRHIDFAGTKYY